MDPGIFCIQRIRAYTYPDRTGSDRIVAGIDPQGVIPQRIIAIKNSASSDAGFLLLSSACVNLFNGKINEP